MPEATPTEGTPSEQDLVKQFALGKIGLDALKPETQASILGGTYEPNAEPAAPQAEAVTETPEAQPSEVGQTPEPAPAQDAPAPKPTPEPRKKRTVEELRELALARANKLNELEQAEKSRLHKLQTDPIFRAKWFQENNIPMPTEAPKAKPDIWSDDFHQGQAQQVESLRAELEAIKQEKAMQSVYRSVELFARKQGHEFQAPLAELNQAAVLVENSGKKGQDALQELVRLGFDDADVQMYDRMVQVQQTMVERGYPDMDIAYYDWQRRNNSGAPAVRQQAVGVADAEAEDRAKRARKMEEVLAHPATLSTQRAMTGEQGITPEYAGKWLDANGHRINDLTPEEQRVWTQIKNIIGIR
jgi:hypothetical protein